MKLKFQVYINGQPIRKSFASHSMKSIWNQYNNWVRNQGECEIIEGEYYGKMAWRNSEGIVEIRPV